MCTRGDMKNEEVLVFIRGFYVNKICFDYTIVVSTESDRKK